MSPSFRLAVIGGDGIGPEVTRAALRVLDAAERVGPTGEVVLSDVVPEMVSWEWEVAKRGGRIRLDYTQNAINKTLVAPFSTRPVAGGRRRRSRAGPRSIRSSIPASTGRGR